MLILRSGTGKPPYYLVKRFGSKPAKFLRVGWEQEGAFAEEMSNRATGSIPPTFADMSSDSEDEDD
jgi:hypothetical protein